MNTKGFSLLALPLLLFTITWSAYAQGAESTLVPIAASVVVSDFVQTTKESILDVIDSLEGSAGNSMFRARQHLELLIDQIEMIAENSIELTFSELNSAERQFFESVQIHLDSLNNMSETTASEVEQIATILSNGLRGLPLAATYPIVSGYYPLFVRSEGATNDDTIRVQISGVLLSNHEPSLLIESIPCDISEKIDTRLVFLCDKRLFSAPETVKTVSGKLVVYEKLSFIKSIFGFDSKSYDYNIGINVIPLALGTATITVTTVSSTPERNERSAPFSYRNNHCRGSRDQLFEFNVTKDWIIDQASVTASCRSSSRSSCNGLRNITASSFGYLCSIANSGYCGPFWRDGRGSCSGSVSWEEVRTPENLDDITLDSVELFWGRDQAIVLPAGVRSIRIAIEKVDGTRRIVTASEVRDPWFDVKVDLRNRNVIIQPEVLRRAMR